MAGMDLAYWISPKGDTIKPTMYHIGAIISNPRKFGETDQTIKDTFEKNGEPISNNSEGNARNDIMMRVMQRGFIRIRKHNIKRSQKWIIELYDMSNKKANYIANWAKTLIDNKMVDDVYADVTITDLRILRSAHKNLTGLSRALMESVDVVQGGMTIYKSTLTKLSHPIDTLEVVIGEEYSLVEWDDYSEPIDTLEKIRIYLQE